MSPWYLPDSISASETPTEAISGEVKKEREKNKGEQVIRSERYFGRIERSFSLPQEIDEPGINAQYADGVLKLNLPLREKTSAKSIEIK